VRDDRAFDALKTAAFDLGAEPALILDTGGFLVAANEAAEALFGQNLSLLARGRFVSALPPGSVLGALIARCLDEERPVRERALEITLPGHSGLSADAAAAPLGGGAVLLTLRVRQALTGSDSAGDVAGLRSVVGLGRMLAHEIKNPLAGIRGAAQLLRDGAAPADLQFAELIIEETERIRRLVDRMEAFSEDSAPARSAVNIHRVLDRVMALAANGVADGLVLHAVYDPSLPPALGEEDQLIQVFLNLAKNAAEAAHSRGDGRGEITISTAYRHGVKVRGHRNRDGGGGPSGAPLEVRITDNGPGVPPAVRDCLFEPFVTTKANGTGLGLALVAKIVNAHGGMIDFESAAGRTAFRVLLPVAPVPAL
jgi:two-component system nitrogen regulation sensor histidine kinase GlnL